MAPASSDVPLGRPGIAVGLLVALLGLGLAAIAHFDPRDDAFPSGRLPVWLAAGAFFAAGITIVASARGRSAPVATALLLSCLLGVPVAVFFHGDVERWAWYQLAGADLGRNLDWLERGPRFREAAMQRLTERPPEELGPAVEPLFALLSHPDPAVRTSASAILRRTPLGPVHAHHADLLVGYLASPEVDLRRLAALVLPIVAPERPDLPRRLAAALADGDVLVRDWARDSLVALGAGAAPALDEALETGPRDARGTVVETLSRIHGEPASRAVLHRRLLAAGDRDLRWHGVALLRALGRDGAAESAPLLATAVADPDAAVRDAAFLALAEVAPEALARLDEGVVASLLAAELWAVREEAWKSAVDRGTSAEIVVPALIVALEGPDTYAREAALRRLPPASVPMGAVPAIARAIQEDRRQGLRAAAADLLDAMGPDGAAAAPALVAVVRDADTYAAARALAALGSMGPAASAVLPDLETLATRGHVLESDLRRAIARISAPPPPAGMLERPP